MNNNSQPLDQVVTQAKYSNRNEYYLNVLGMPHWQSKSEPSENTQVDVNYIAAAHLGPEDALAYFNHWIDDSDSQLEDGSGAECIVPEEPLGSEQNDSLERASQESFSTPTPTDKDPRIDIDNADETGLRQADSEQTMVEKVVDVTGSASESLVSGKSLGSADSISSIEDTIPSTANIAQGLSYAAVAEGQGRYTIDEPMVHPVPFREALLALENKVIECRSCTARAYGDESVRGHFLHYHSSNAEGNIVLAVSSPSEQEYRQGSYLLPPYWQLLNAILGAVHLDHFNIYLTGHLKCCAADNHLLESQEWQSCQSFFEQELEIIQPRLVVNLGTQTFSEDCQGDSETEQSVLGLSQARLKAAQISLANQSIPEYTTFHPAFLYRNPLFKGKALEDWIKIAAQLV